MNNIKTHIQINDYIDSNNHNIISIIMHNAIFCNK